VQGHLFIAPGDITQLGAHAIAYSASGYLGRDGNLYSAFQANVPAFPAWFDELRHRSGTDNKVGDTFWLTLDLVRRPHGLVVTVSTGSSTIEDKAGRAVRAALTTAVDRLRGELGRRERLLIGLPAFRVGRGGDHRQRLQSARQQIAAALDTLASMQDVDAVIVTYTTPLYQIFLEARRELQGEKEPAVRYPALEEALQSRECVVFVGAGMSSGAGLPDWSALIRRLSDDLGIESNGRIDYLDLAQWYRERFGPHTLAEVIRRTFTTTSLPTLGHYLLTALPLRHVITTNYDDLLERALTAQKRHPIKVLKQEDVARTGQGGVYVVKLHGDAAHPEEIVLCRDDYDEFFQRRPAMALLLEGLLLNQTFFFVGYGLRDPNFRQIYARIARMLREARRPAFATTFEASGDTGNFLTRQWRNKQLHLITIPGITPVEQEQHFLRFLDYLADQVTRERPRLFLAPEVEVPAALVTLRNLLVEYVGKEVEGLGEFELGTSWSDIRHLVEVLEFLTEHGWRPGRLHGNHLCRLWVTLAEYAPVPERRRLLIMALGCAEAFTDVQRIRQLLAELDKRT
jgi:hypothetical protein